MPRPNPQIPTAAPVVSTLPTKKYPHLRNVIKELDFACATCSSAFGQPVYVSFMDAVRDPISGPGHYHTTFGLLCPDCRTAPQDGPFITMGMINLLAVPADYKRPKRANSSGGGESLAFDDEDEAPKVHGRFEEEEDEYVEAPQPRRLKTKKKTTDLSPASRGRKAKGAVKAAMNKRAQANEGQQA